MIIKRFDESKRWDNKRKCPLIASWYMVARVSERELSELKKRNETLYRMLWTHDDYIQQHKCFKGELAWTSPELTVNGVIDYFHYVR